MHPHTRARPVAVCSDGNCAGATMRLHRCSVPATDRYKSCTPKGSSGKSRTVLARPRANSLPVASSATHQSAGCDTGSFCFAPASTITSTGRSLSVCSLCRTARASFTSLAVSTENPQARNKARVVSMPVCRTQPAMSVYRAKMPACLASSAKTASLDTGAP